MVAHLNYTDTPKDKKIVLDRIKAGEWDKIHSST